MKLIQIEYFLKIAECLSITKAAELLYISQPALSRQLSLLEKELNVPLIRRLPYGIELTEAGDVFAKGCRRIMDELDHTIHDTVSLGTDSPRVFRIGCFDGAYTNDFLPELYSSLKEKLPDIKIEVSRLAIRDNWNAFENNETDVMIELVFDDEEFDELNKYNQKVLSEREGVVIYSVDSPLAKLKNITPKDLEREPFLMSDENPVIKKMDLQILKNIGVKNPRIEVMDNMVTLMSCLELGQGYRFLSRGVAEQNPRLLAYPMPGLTRTRVTAFWKKTNGLANRMMKS